MLSHEPKVVLCWLSVDPLAVYNPIKETEFYFDGQHNGGVYNPGNLAAYIYCYQNPIKYIDPNGKQVNSSVILEANYKNVIGRDGKATLNQYGYKFTESTTHLLSLVSNINKKDISNTQVDFSKYGDAGASITLGSSPQEGNITHFYDKKKKYGATDGGNFYEFLKRNAHEVGHLPQLKDGSSGQIASSIVEYLQNVVDGQDWHDGSYSTKEKAADVGENEFKSFNSFIDKNYGANKLKDLFENKNNTQKDIIERIDQWWGAYTEK